MTKPSDWEQARDVFGRVYKPSPDIKTWQRQLAEAYARGGGAAGVSVPEHTRSVPAANEGGSGDEPA